MDAVDFVIISIGDELLRGETVDTNSTWLSAELSRLGLQTVERFTVPDDVDAISAAIGRAQIVAKGCILTGGLGPTVDDVTRDALARYLGKELRLDEALLRDVEKRYAARGMALPDERPREAMIPDGVLPLENRVGIAPGMMFEDDARLIVALPGVPSELKDIFEKELRPILSTAGRKSFAVESFYTTGIPESVLSKRIARAFDAEGLDSAGLAFYPSFFGVEVRLGSAASADFDRKCAVVEKECGRWCYSMTEKSLPAVVGSLLVERGAAVATAESCTGGLLAARMVDVPGASDWFGGGVVAYSNRAKAEILNVNPADIERLGAVSAEVAYQMARGAAARFHADYALSTTGIAGPTGGTPEKPLGLIYYAMRTPRGIRVRKNIIAGGRNAHRFRASQAALAMLWLELDNRYDSHEWADGSSEVLS